MLNLRPHDCMRMVISFRVNSVLANYTTLSEDEEVLAVVARTSLSSTSLTSIVVQFSFAKNNGIPIKRANIKNVPSPSIQTAKAPAPISTRATSLLNINVRLNILLLTFRVYFNFRLLQSSKFRKRYVYQTCLLTCCSNRRKLFCPTILAVIR